MDALARLRFQVIVFHVQLMPRDLMSNPVHLRSLILELTTAGMPADFAQDLTPAEQAEIATTQEPTNAPNALVVMITNPSVWKTLPS